MPTRIAARALFSLLALLAAGLFAPGAARPAAAQCTDILLCPPSSPGVSIEPGGGSWNGSGATLQVVVTISFCDESGGFSSASRKVYLDGADVTSSFGWGTADPVAGCFTTASSTGVVTLTPGSHTLVAGITNTSGQSGADTATYHYSQGSEPPTGPYDLRVTPDARGVERAPGVRATERFTVTNRGSNTTTVAMAPVCTGAGASGCGASLGTLTIPGGGAVSVGVNYVTGSAGAAATVGLAAWKSGDSTTANDAGSYQVTVKTLSSGRGDGGDVTALDRSSCLMLPAMLDAAYECGDLRLAHALPGTRVLNRGFAPTLLYNSQHAHPYPIVGATVTPVGVPGPTSVVATLTLAGVTRADTFPGWTGAAKRVAVGLDATGLTSGFYGYDFQVKAHYASGQAVVLASASGRLPIVNRHASRFGRGWWLAGLEEVKPFGTTLMWIGGDGSTLRYDSVGAGRWASEKYAGTDTIVRAGGGYARLITGGDSVVFDALGRHVRTASRRGTRTEFAWTDSVLTGISLPKGTPFNSGPGYVLEYLNPYGVLSKVTAPSAGAARVVTFQNDDRRVTAISGPDTTSVLFGYADAKPRITSRRDRRGVWSHYGYDAGSRLSSAYTATGPLPGMAGTYVPVYYLSQESRGIDAAVVASQVYTVFNGPRQDGDVPDYVYFWVDRRGAPYMMQENGGAPTHIHREDPSWPGRVTRVTYPDGREVTSSYDHAGRLSSTTDWGRAVDGRYATTLYEWDERCNALSRVTLPEGEVTLRGYTPQCLPEWVQPGHQTSRRVTFAYEPATHASAPGLTASVTEPGGHTQRFGYDARGNLASVVSPVSDTTFFTSDAIGRVVRTRTPIQAGLFQTDTTVYDVRDRVVRTESRGPAIPNGTGGYFAGAQTVVVRTGYDPEGAVVEVMRGTPSSPTGVDSIVTRWKHDALRRVVAELAPDNTPASWSDNPRDTTVYNEAGLPVWVRTRRGDTLRTEYDAAGRPKWSAHAAVRHDSTSRGVPSLGLSPATCRPLAETPADHVYPFYPNASGCALLIPADTAFFKYDPLGRLVEAKNASAIVRRGYYGDGLLRADTLIIHKMEGGASARAAYVLGYDYDLNGRRTRMTHPAALSPVANAVTQYAYDPATGALASVTDPLGNAFAFRYDVRGQLDSLGMPGGMRQRFDHDSAGRLSRYRAWIPSAAGQSALNDVTFAYDRRGKMLESTDAGLGQEQMSARYSGLGYLVRSIYESTGQIQNATAMSETTAWMVYDPLGNSYQTVNSTDNQTGGTGVFSPLFGSLSQRSSSSAFQPHTGRLMVNYDNEISRELSYDPAGNVVFEMTSWLDASKRGRDRVSYHGGDGKLRAVDGRTRTSITDASATWEEYRYDALGRRVQVLTREWCTTGGAACNYATVRRTVWDGDQVLYEIRMAESEGDSDGLPSRQPRGANNFSLNAMLGRVLLTHGPGIDQPLSAIRMGYGEHYGGSEAVHYQNWGAFSVIPLWNQRGQAPFVAFGNGFGGSAPGVRKICPPGFAATRCLGTHWLLAWDAYGPRTNGSVVSPDGAMKVWLGGIMDDQQDASGLLYRRNRYYDPSSGRFTQEDPIGLAGGLNLYGFANGDPVSYSDPYGLCIWLWREECRNKSSSITYGDFKHMLYRGWNPARVWTMIEVRDRAAQLVARKRESWGTDEVGADKANAFRHIYGSCQLTRHRGIVDARRITSAHERRWRRGDEEQARDSRNDTGNNEIGMQAGASREDQSLNCEQIADREVNEGHYYGRGGQPYVGSD